MLKEWQVRVKLNRMSKLVQALAEIKSEPTDYLESRELFDWHVTEEVGKDGMLLLTHELDQFPIDNIVLEHVFSATGEDHLLRLLREDRRISTI